MAPKKKERVYYSQSQNHPRFKYLTKSSGNDFLELDYQEKMLHRLRPQIHRLERRSGMAYKSCVSKIRRKKTRLPVKRCFVRYKRKHRRPVNRNLRVNSSQKAAGDFRFKNAVVRPILQPVETSIPNVPHDRNRRKPTSFIQWIKDYVSSTFRKGTKWATKYVYKAFKYDNKSQNGSGSPKREEKNAISPPSPHIIQAGQRDYKDKTRKRYKGTSHPQRAERVSKSSGKAMAARGCGENFSAEKPGNLPLASNGKRHHCCSSVVTNLSAMCSQANDRHGNFLNKRGQTRSQGGRKLRRRDKRTKRIARRVMSGYDKTAAKKVQEPRSFVKSNSLELINSKEPSVEMKIKNGNELANNEENQSEVKDKKIEIGKRDSQEIVRFGQSAETLKKDLIKYNKKDKFLKPLEGNESFEKHNENKW